MSVAECLNDADLWPLASGGRAGASVAGHLRDCPACRERLHRIAREVRFLYECPAGEGPATGDAACETELRQLVRRIAVESPAESDCAFPASPGGGSGGDPGPDEALRPRTPPGVHSSSRSSPEPATPPASHPDRSDAFGGDGSPWPGGRIGKYLVGECLGRGGQGSVFRGWDPELQRNVAIKVGLRRIQRGDGDGSRIITEGSLLAQVDHPHLARVYDCGVANGVPYLVMEWIPGITLREFVSRHPVEPDRMRRMLMEVAGALAAAHRSGILHLDVKPENVMVTIEGDCRLIDLGTGWLLSQERDPQEVVIAGTLEYMSPEQLEGRIHDFSPATDVYGLGGLLCFLLTGSPPLARSAVTASRSEEDLRERIVRLETERTSDRRLAAICRKALAADPLLRFPDAEAFRRAVDSSRRSRRAGRASVLTGMLLITLGLSGLIEELSHPEEVDSAAEREPAVVRDGAGVRPPARPEVLLQLTTISPSRETYVFFWSPLTGVTRLPGIRPDREGERFVWQPNRREGGVRIHATGGVFAVVGVISAEPEPVVRDRLAEALRGAEGGRPRDVPEVIEVRCGAEDCHAWQGCPLSILLQGRLASLAAPCHAHLVAFPADFRFDETYPARVILDLPAR